MPHPQMALVALLSCVAIFANVIVGCGSSGQIGSAVVGRSTHLYSGPPRQNGIIARSRASDTKVSASAVLSAPIADPRLPAGAYRELSVSYRVEYRSGLRPAGVNILARTANNPAPVGGSAPLGSGDVQTGQKEVPFSPRETGRIEIEVFAYSHFNTTLGMGRTFIAARQK